MAAPATPEIFTLSFWQTTAARVVHYAAVCAIGAWGIGAVPVEHVSVPAFGVAIAAGVGALYALVEALAGAYIPPARRLPVAALYPAPNQVLDVSVHPRKQAA